MRSKQPTPAAPTRRWRVLALCAWLLCATHALPARAEVIDRVVARVDDGILTQTDIVRYLPIYVQVYGLSPASLSGDACTGSIEEFVDWLIESTLLSADARSRELGVTPAEVSEYIEQQYVRLGLSETQFIGEIERSGIEYADFRDFMELNLNRMRMLQVEVGSRVSVTDADVDRVVARLYPDGIEEVFIETHHIFVQVQAPGDLAEREGLEGILSRQTRLRGGESFASVAADNDDGTARTGGRLGRISVLDLDTTYAQAALGLDIGEVSEPVRSSFGFHLIRLDGVERRPADNVDDVRERILFDLHNERAEQEQTVYLDRVVSEAFVDRRVTDFSWYCGIPLE